MLMYSKTHIENIVVYSQFPREGVISFEWGIQGSIGVGYKTEGGGKCGQETLLQFLWKGTGEEE